MQVSTNFKIILSIFSDHSGIKLEIKLSVENSHICKLRNTSLNRPLFKQKIIKGARKYFKRSNTENTTCHKLWGAAEAMLRGIFTAYKMHILGKKEGGETYGLKISHEIRKTAETGAERHVAGTWLLVGQRWPGKAQTSSGWPSCLVAPRQPLLSVPSGHFNLSETWWPRERKKISSLLKMLKDWDKSWGIYIKWGRWMYSSSH